MSEGYIRYTRSRYLFHEDIIWRVNANAFIAARRSADDRYEALTARDIANVHITCTYDSWMARFSMDLPSQNDEWSPRTRTCGSIRGHRVRPKHTRGTSFVISVIYVFIEVTRITVFLSIFSSSVFSSKIVTHPESKCSPYFDAPSGSITTTLQLLILVAPTQPLLNIFSFYFAST